MMEDNDCTFKLDLCLAGLLSAMENKCLCPYRPNYSFRSTFPAADDTVNKYADDDATFFIFAIAYLCLSAHISV